MPGPAWHVVSEGIVQTDRLSPSGRGLEPVYEIPFIVDSGPGKGHTGTVTIPVANSGPEAVAIAVNKAAENVHGFAGLALDQNGNITS